MLSAKHALKVLQEDDHDYHEVHNEIVEKSRWAILYFSVWENTLDDTLWAIEYSRGSTEYQDEGPEVIDFYEVEAYERVMVSYRAK